MIKRLFHSQLRINMASGVITTVINTVAMMAAYPIYLHFLGYEKYGVWLVLATVLSFAQLGNLGIGQAVMKLVAEEHGRGDIEGIQRYVTTALALLCLSGSLVLIVVLAFKTQIIAAFKLSDENAQMALWLLPYIGILSIYIFIVHALNATLSGLGRMDLANYTQSFGRIVAVTVASILLYTGRGIESLLIGNTLSYVYIHVVSLIFIKRTVHIRFLRTGNLDAQRGKRILRFGGGVFGSSLIGMLLSPFNKLMLSRYAGVSTIPIYEIAFTGSMQVRGLLEAGLRALMPEISRISADITLQAQARIRAINKQAVKLVLIGGVPLFCGIYIFASVLLKLWLRERFVDTLPNAFRIMLVVSFVSFVGVPANHTLMGLGKVRYIVMASLIGATVNVVSITTYHILMRDLSVYGVGVCLTMSVAAGAVYLICKARHLLTCD